MRKTVRQIVAAVAIATILFAGIFLITRSVVKRSEQESLNQVASAANETGVQSAETDITNSDIEIRIYNDISGFDPSIISDYYGEDVIVINHDEPFFTKEQKLYAGTYIMLSEIDDLGRCGPAMACVGQETIPAQEREDILKIHPSGWNQTMYNGEFLYNRSHLLMYALTGLNAEDRNLITGTEYFNKELMLPLESTVLWTAESKNAHIIYRVTPVFDGDDLVAKGVLMEAYCIEYPDECTFCRFVYNIEPGIEIDYKTGEIQP